MSGLAETFSKLRALSTVGLQGFQFNRLESIGDFGSNPGNLRGKAFIPFGLRPKSPLVVVLHGCTQTPDGYDAGSGWSALADARQFAVLYPEQQRANNPTLCFNWFEPNDTKRGTGETASIRHMIDAMSETYDLDPDRIFITGLSAGGAMTSAMLAAHPDLFAGGAIIGGLPAGSAHGVGEALQQMRSPRKSQFARIRRRVAQQRTLPIISVWHGGADHTVSPANADAIVEQ